MSLPTVIRCWYLTMLCCAGPLLAADPVDDALKQRIAALREFPEWQKKPLSAKDVATCLQQLRTGNIAQQRDALEKLAYARPDVALQPVVVRESNSVHKQHHDSFSLAMSAHINAAWSDAKNGIELWKRVRSAGGIAQLEKMLGTANGLVELQVLAALGHCGDPRAADVLVRHYTDVNPMAERMLEVLGPPAAPAVVQLLSHNDWRVRLDAVRLLGKLGTAEQIDTLQKLADDPNGNVRTAVPKAIQQIKERAAAG